MPLDLEHIIIFLASGLLLGIFGGSLGIGGGLLALPFLSFLGFELPIARLSCISNNIIISTATAIRHHKNNRSFQGCPQLILGSLIGLALGAWVASYNHRTFLWILYCSLSIIILILFITKSKNGDENFTENIFKFICIGSVAGFFSMTLGIGGGGIIVPMLIRWAKVPMKKAIVLSIGTIFATSSLALGIAYFMKGSYWNTMGIKISLLMFPGMLIGGYVGADLGQKLPDKIIKTALCLLLLIGLLKGLANAF